MKLNYRDKIIAAILIAVAILLIGFFALVKPKYKQIKADKTTLADVQKQKKDIEAKINMIPSLKEQILKIYDDTSAITANFVPVNDVNNPVVIDRYMQKFADETKVKLKTVELAESKLGPISYYFNSITDNDADLRNAADVNGSLAEEMNARMAESTSVGQRAKESILQTQYAISIVGTKKNVFDYLEALKKFDKTVVVNSVNIADYSFGKDAATQKNVTLPESKDGEEVSVEAEGEKITNTSEVKITITLYSVYEMPKPDVDTVPSN